MAKIQDPVAEVESRMLEGVTPDELEWLDGTLARMTGNLERADHG